MTSNPLFTKCPFCEYEWQYKPTKHTKNYYACCPQCRKYIPLKKDNIGDM